MEASRLNKQSLEKNIEQMIDEYNKYRTPEVTARLLSIKDNFFKIELIGHCHTCGFYDYFDDFRLLLEDFGLKSKIIEIDETEEGGIAEFKFK
jgi:superoxide reductase